MKGFSWLVLILVVSQVSAEPFDWRGFKKSEIDLKLPLLTVVGSKGVLACGYINPDTCNKTGEACAVVSGVKNHNEMLSRPVIALSENAKKLGVKIGMTGAEALTRMR